MKEEKARKIELKTDRLIIRTPDEKDAHDVFVLMSDLEIAESTGFRPMSTGSEAEGKIRREMDGGLMFCISESGFPEKVLGVFEVTPHKTITVSGEKCNYEICYFLHKEFRGKGYMTEVVKRMKRYLFDERMADSLTIAVLPRNDASRRVALKSGFTYEGLERKMKLSTLNIIPFTKKNTSIPMKKYARKSWLSHQSRNGLMTVAFFTRFRAMLRCSLLPATGYSASMSNRRQNAWDWRR